MANKSGRQKIQVASTILPSWVLLRRESWNDSTARPWKSKMQSFPLETRVTLVELSIDSAVSPLLNLEAAQ